MKKNNTLFFLIILLAFLLRFFNLGKIPAGFYSDEASLGYNAYSILKTGRDEYGIFLPLSFKSFGEYKAPLYVYVTVPLVMLFGLSEFTARLPAAIFSFLTIVVSYFLVKRLLKNERLALIASFLLAISPWHLQFTRIAYEGSLAVFLLSMGTLLFLYGLENGWYLYLSAALFALIIYSHYSVRVFIPLYIITLLFIFWKKITQSKKEIFISAILMLLFTIPILPEIFSSAGLTRANYISLFTDKGQISAIEQKRSEHLWSGQKYERFSKILHNKFTEHSSKFISNYLSHFDYSFIFITGDVSQFYKTPNSGLLPLTLLPFFLIGFYKLFQLDYKAKNIVLSWLFLAPIPSSLTRLGVSANRAFIMILPLVIIIALGIVTIVQTVNYQQKRLFAAIITLFVVIEYITYLDNYYVHLSLRYARDTFVVTKKAVKTIENLGVSYDQIWISHKLGGYIHILFHLKYPPALYQKEAKLGPLNEYGFGQVEGFDKYKFKALPQYFDLSQNILYVVPSEDMPDGIIPIQKVTYPDGSDAFAFFDTKQIQNNGKI